MPQRTLFHNFIFSERLNLYVRLTCRRTCLHFPQIFKTSCNVLQWARWLLALPFAVG